jgi:hypothetical protein
MKQVVIMPGGFHPFHAGHAALYRSAQQAFPGADVYVAATNDTSERPFPFAVKEKLAQLAGIPKGKFVQVKSPFGAEEITSRYDPENTQLIFVKSEKNSRNGPSPEGPFPAEPDPRTGQLPLVTRGARKGLPVSDRLQYYRDNQPMDPMSRHSYLAYLPTVEFGPGMTSGSEIRKVWPKFNEQLKTDLVMSLYPKTQTNPKLAANVVQMLDNAIGGVDEDISRRGFLRGAGAAAGMAAVGAVGAKELGRPTIIAIVRIGDQTKQFNLGTKFDTSKQAEEFVTNFLDKQGLEGYTIEIQRGYTNTNENQGWAATYESDGITAGTGVTGGMHASYQDRYNQPTTEDYVEERRS